MKAYIFACTNRTEQECFDRMLLSTNKLYADNILQVKKGDLLFLFNMDKDMLYGTFKAKSEGKKDIVPEAWRGKYPYQVKVERENGAKTIKDAKKVMSQLGINWRNILNKEQLELLINYVKNPSEFDWNLVKKRNGKEVEEKTPLRINNLMGLSKTKLR
ncbi:MAG: hypothetical protein Q8N08_01255 [Methanobacteriaceae archaeon]|nr:hypothetical protein [Methanobacteriaceae archaeon]